MKRDTYSRQELLQDWSDISGFTIKDLKEALDSLEVVLRKAILSGKEITLKNIGKFTFKQYKGRQMVIGGSTNFQTGERIDTAAIPPHEAPYLKFCRSLKDEIKEMTRPKEDGENK